MKLEELKERRAILEKDIERLLFDFTRETDTTIKGAYISDILFENKLGEKRPTVVHYRFNVDITI